jgi:hypothetical protein
MESYVACMDDEMASFVACTKVEVPSYMVHKISYEKPFFINQWMTMIDLRFLYFDLSSFAVV